MLELLDRLLHEGPTAFSRDEIAATPDLFQQRAALIYTPTEELPEEHVGRGKLDVVLPLPLPTMQECSENAAYRAPRLWLDLLQRATGKLRWRPINPAIVTIVTYDAFIAPVFAPLPKALEDALKASTTGRRDGRQLHYFGAIEDDAPEFVAELNLYQSEIDDPSDAHCRVIVQAVPEDYEPSNSYTSGLLPDDFDFEQPHNHAL